MYYFEQLRGRRPATRKGLRVRKEKGNSNEKTPRMLAVAIILEEIEIQVL